MFENSQQETPVSTSEGSATPQSTSNLSPFDTMLSEIKNEKGEPKYRSVEDGLNALKHSQEYILQQKQDILNRDRELEELRKRVQEIDVLKDTVSKLTQRQPEPEQQGSKLDEEVLASLVDKRLSINRQLEVASQNQRDVAGKLKESFGDKARDVFYEKASQLGFSGQEFEVLAAKSPKAVLTMFNLDGDVAPKQTFKSPAQSKINTEHFQGNPTSFIGAEKESIPLGGGEKHYNMILENSKKMVEELHANGMTVDDLSNPVNYMKYIRNKG